MHDMMIYDTNQYHAFIGEGRAEREMKEWCALADVGTPPMTCGKPVTNEYMAP